VNGHIFERELPGGWTYPCTTDDIAAHLEKIPSTDLEGLWAIGLVPSTRKDNRVYARYFDGDKPAIYIYSHVSDMRYKQPPNVKRADVESGPQDELRHGMRVEQVGSRWYCVWEPEQLRQFILYHVLPHEIGHHVCHQRRLRQGLRGCPGNDYCEQFAEAYARRMEALIGDAAPAVLYSAGTPHRNGV
jgi:hypothetical protein